MEFITFLWFFKVTRERSAKNARAKCRKKLRGEIFCGRLSQEIFSQPDFLAFSMKDLNLEQAGNLADGF